MSESEAAKAAPAGWVIAVLLAADSLPMQRHYYAVGHADRSKAEWTAVDWALRRGEVAASPLAGAEPVEALKGLTRPRMATLGLASGEVRELGCKSPRRWLT